MRVSVIGTGYVGLVSGVCLAEKGHNVICIDVDQEKVDKINQGISPIYERNLDELLRKNIHVNLKADTDLSRAVYETEISLIAVGTPFDGNEIDLSYIENVSRHIGKALGGKDSYHMVVVKSTVVPGTTDEVVLPILEKARKVDLRIVTADIPRQEVITRDNIPVLANTVVYFKVEKPSDAIIKIENFAFAVRQYTQAALRDVVGNMELDGVLTERDKIAADIREIVDQETNEWGIDIKSIKMVFCAWNIS